MNKTQLTRHQFPAVVEPIHVELDEADDELPTDPIIPLGERKTERPSGEIQAALQAATKPSDEWRFEPRFSFDPRTGSMVLAEPYTAREADRFGNVFQVGCPVGVEMPIPARPNHAQTIRSALVAATLRTHWDVLVHPHNGGVPIALDVDAQWRLEVLRAFVDGDNVRAGRQN